MIPLIDTVKNILTGEIEFGLVFGSVISGRLTPESDIDIGAYFKQGQNNLGKYLNLKNDLETALNRDIDLVTMNSCDIIIAMQILTNGEIIINNNPGLFVLYKAQKISEYIDFKKDRKIVEDNILKGRIYA